MRNADKQEARTESDRVLQTIIFRIMADNMELFKQFNDISKDVVYVNKSKSRPTDKRKIKQARAHKNNSVL
jgi:type I restriction enzyme R subunit